jgi:hypothetical protein
VSVKKERVVMKRFEFIVIIFVIIIASNSFCYAAKTAPVDLKYKLTELKSSLEKLKTKLNLLSKKLGLLKKTLEETPVIPCGNTGFWFSLKNKYKNINIGIKIFRSDDKVQRDAECLLEREIYKFITTAYQEIKSFLKSEVPTSWTKFPFSEIVFDSKSLPADLSHEIKSEIDAIYVKQKLDDKYPYMVLQSFESPNAFHAKTMSNAWYNQAWIDFYEKQAKRLGLDTNQKADYETKIFEKIGHIILLFYFLGITIEDSDIFVEIPETIQSKTVSTDALIKATSIHLTDFGEAKVIYIFDKNTLVFVSKEIFLEPGKNLTPKNYAIDLINLLKTKINYDHYDYVPDCIAKSFNPIWKKDFAYKSTKEILSAIGSKFPQTSTYNKIIEEGLSV